MGPGIHCPIFPVFCISQMSSILGNLLLPGGYAGPQESEIDAALFQSFFFDNGLALDCQELDIAH